MCPPNLWARPCAAPHAPPLTSPTQSPKALPQHRIVVREGARREGGGLRVVCVGVRAVHASCKCWSMPQPCPPPPPSDGTRDALLHRGQTLWHRWGAGGGAHRVRHPLTGTCTPPEGVRSGSEGSTRG